MSCLRASIHTEDCIGTGWSLQSCAAHHHAVQPPTCLCLPHVVSQALSDEVLVRLEGPACFRVFPAHVVSWRRAPAAIYRPVNVVGTGPCRHSLGTTLPGVGFSGVSWGPAVLPLRCSFILSFPPLTHRTTEGGPGSVSFTDEEWALCEWAGPSHPLCRSDKWEVSKAPSFQGAEDKKWCLTRKWGQEMRACTSVDKGGFYITVFRMVLQRLPVYDPSVQERFIYGGLKGSY